MHVFYVHKEVKDLIFTQEEMVKLIVTQHHRGMGRTIELCRYKPTKAYLDKRDMLPPPTEKHVVNLPSSIYDFGDFEQVTMTYDFDTLIRMRSYIERGHGVVDIVKKVEKEIEKWDSIRKYKNVEGM